MSAISASAPAGIGAVASAKPEVSSAQIKPVQESAVSTVATPSSPVYSSPFIYIDPTSNRVVFETRDPETGKLTNQFPSSSQLHAYRLQQTISGTPVVPSAALSEAASEAQAKPIAASGKSGIAT